MKKLPLRQLANWLCNAHWWLFDHCKSPQHDVLCQTQLLRMSDINVERMSDHQYMVQSDCEHSDFINVADKLISWLAWRFNYIIMYMCDIYAFNCCSLKESLRTTVADHVINPGCHNPKPVSISLRLRGSRNVCVGTGSSQLSVKRMYNIERM